RSSVSSPFRLEHNSSVTTTLRTYPLRAPSSCWPTAGAAAISAHSSIPVTARPLGIVMRRSSAKIDQHRLSIGNGVGSPWRRVDPSSVRHRALPRGTQRLVCAPPAEPASADFSRSFLMLNYFVAAHPLVFQGGLGILNP